MKSTIGVAGLAIVMLLGSSSALASSCVQISVCDAYLSKDIPLIFRGEAVEVASVPKEPPPTSVPEQSSAIPLMLAGSETESIRFAIREVLKGKPQGSEIQVLARRGTYQVGKEYLIYIGLNQATHSQYINSCVRWQDMSEANSKVSDLQVLRQLSLTDGNGAIVGRFYLGGPDMGGAQAPLANTQVVVSINGPVNRDTQSERNSGEQGYLLAGISPGDYTVSANGPAGVAILPVDKANKRVSVTANGCREVDWFLRVDSHISGRVTDPMERPVPNANVGLFLRGTREQDLARGRFAPISTRVTDADGQYDFAGINPGDYSVVLHPSPPKKGDAYPPVFYPAFALPSEAQVLHLMGPEKIDGINLVRPEELHPATVGLTVNRVNGTAIADAMVVVTDPGFALQTAAFGRTDAEGRLKVQLFSGRAYKITASTPDPNGQQQETPQCAGPVEFVAENGMELTPLIPDKTFHACQSGR